LYVLLGIALPVTGLQSDYVYSITTFGILAIIWCTSFVSGIIATRPAKGNSKGLGIFGIVAGLLGIFVMFFWLLVIGGLMGENFN
jgi:uncharacterized membrane protein